MARSVDMDGDCLAHAHRSADQRPGQSQFLTSPMLAKPLEFSELSLEDPTYDVLSTRPTSSDARRMERLAAQGAQSAGPGSGDEDAIADEKRPEGEKRDLLQRALNMAASNGDVDRVRKILSGKARPFVDVN